MAFDAIAYENGLRASHQKRMPESESIQESRLLDEALRGSESAFAEIYSRKQSSIFRFALHMTGSQSIAEDVTQDVFLTLLKSGRSFDAGRGSLQSFLFGVARNHILKRRHRDRSSIHEEISEEIDGGDEFFEDLTRRETVETVRRAVISLPETYREAVVLCDLEGASYEEAAGILECPIGTVRSRLSRGRAMLAQKLAGHTAASRAGSVNEAAARSSR